MADHQGCILRLDKSILQTVMQIVVSRQKVTSIHRRAVYVSELIARLHVW